MKRQFRIPAALPCGGIPFRPDAPWLAPLAGYSDLPFRLLCRAYGAAVCESEMISARGLICKSPGSDALLAQAQGDDPLIIQLFGSSPETLAEAVRLLRRHGYNVFDLNMGCPVRKVMRTGAGAALLADPEKALAVAKAMLLAASETGADLPATPAPVGFKFRLPPDGKKGSAAWLGRRLEDLGASWLALHPRRADMGYGGSADWNEIRLLAEACAIPVIASGDLMTAESGAMCMAQTGAASVMYARGALRDPFIFTAHRALLQGLPAPDPEKGRLVEIVRRHIELTRLHCGDARAFAKIRSIIPRYVRNLAGVGELRLRLSRCQSWDGLSEILADFMERK